MAQRLPALERGLVGVERSDVARRSRELLAADALNPLTPIDDVRATREYRLEAARDLVLRALSELAQEAAR